MTIDEQPRGPVRVLLADDEPLIRAGVRAILQTDHRLDVLAEAGTGAEAVELCRRHHPDVVLLDIQMPLLDGISAAEQIRTVSKSTKIIILTTFGEDAYIDAAMAGGAAGFVLKASDPRELITAVHAVSRGAAYLSPRVARRIAERLGDGGSAAATSAAAQRRVAALTDRERDVLALLGAGLSNAEIGDRLFLVEGTVKGHVSSILLALQVRNRVQAAILAYQAGLVDDARP